MVTTQCSHSFAFLATEQLNWSNWGFSAFSKGTSKVAAEGWENITHSFKWAGLQLASLTSKLESAILHLCITSSVQLCYKCKNTHELITQCAPVWNTLYCSDSHVCWGCQCDSCTIWKWGPHTQPHWLHSYCSGDFPNICMHPHFSFESITDRLWCITIPDCGITLITKPFRVANYSTAIGSWMWI